MTLPEFQHIPEFFRKKYPFLENYKMSAEQTFGSTASVVIRLRSPGGVIYEQAILKRNEKETGSTLTTLIIQGTERIVARIKHLEGTRLAVYLAHKRRAVL